VEGTEVSNLAGAIQGTELEDIPKVAEACLLDVEGGV